MSYDHFQKENRLRKEFGELKAEIEKRWESLLEVEGMDFDCDCLVKQVNLNESIFNMTVKSHTDLISCIPNIQVFWEKPWGANITCKFICT